MFITNNHASFHLWGKENLVKHQKVSKYYDHDYRSFFCYCEVLHHNPFFLCILVEEKEGYLDKLDSDFSTLIGQILKFDELQIDILTQIDPQLLTKFDLVKAEIEVCSPETYLKPSRTPTMELFCENSYRLKAVNYFRKKGPSLMFDWVLNTPLQSHLYLFMFLIKFCMVKFHNKSYDSYGLDIEGFIMICGGAIRTLLIIYDAPCFRI